MRGSRLIVLVFCECEGKKMGSQGMAQEQGVGDMEHITGDRLFHLLSSCTVLAHIGCHAFGPSLPYDTL